MPSPVEATLTPYLVDQDDDTTPARRAGGHRILSLGASLVLGVVTILALAVPRGPMAGPAPGPVPGPAPEPGSVTLGRFDAAMYQAGRSAGDPCRAKQRTLAAWRGRLTRSQPTEARRQIVRTALAEFAAAVEACQQIGVGHTRYSASIMAQRDSEAFRLLTTLDQPS